MEKEYGLPETAKYEFLSKEELLDAGFAGCSQTLLVVRSLAGGHYVVACRGTMDVSDALVDLNIVHRTVSLGEGAAHAGFLERAKSIPLDFFRRLLIRNERVVLTGHSLGGAVASLVTLRLLEATGRWCHEQVQCYTFGSPFFADYRLAKYINTHYKRHFLHFVSRSDLVPKVMPMIHTLYCLWAGLHVGPLEDVFRFSRPFHGFLQCQGSCFIGYWHLLFPSTWAMATLLQDRYCLGAPRWRTVISTITVPIYVQNRAPWWGNRLKNRGLTVEISCPLILLICKQKR
ncbi:hypothetical protein KP509_06G088800 [Ceratopteris richardii]|uniref:Fungal lipase-type domain-containing protein n=1 Tax=Ceratopteris richardii TaxID=49495 RepID=A0A8T2UR06_CERRI|nr:hypothetical protein KP509_06G088800 [Ceratopteris richardii]